jgi:hypothetical protein
MVGRGIEGCETEDAAAETRSSTSSAKNQRQTTKHSTTTNNKTHIHIKTAKQHNITHLWNSPVE